MLKVDSLIFDLDGTLVDSAQDIADSLNETLSSFGFPSKSREEVKKLVGDGVRSLLKRATGIHDETALEKVLEKFKACYNDHLLVSTALYPGVSETLDFYRDKKVGLVSNKPYDMVLKTLDHFSLRKRFSSVLGAESTANKKPHAEPVLKTLEVLNVSPTGAVMVGDGVTDIQAGKSAGTWTCAVTYGYRDLRELSSLKPNFCIDRMEDLKNHFC